MGPIQENDQYNLDIPNKKEIHTSGGFNVRLHPQRVDCVANISQWTQVRRNSDNDLGAICNENPTSSTKIDRTLVTKLDQVREVR